MARSNSTIAALVFLLCTLLVPPPSWANSRSVAALSPVLTTAPAFTSARALVVGIDKYENGWRPLSKAVEDAVAVKAALEASGFDQVALILNPDRDELEAAFRDFVYGVGRDPDSRALIWFAGHGHTIRGEGYLVPRDAPLPGQTPKADAEFRRNALSLRRFGEYLREINARHVLAIFDSCFAGTIFNATRSHREPPAIAAAAAGRVRQIVTSGRAGEEVADDGMFRRLFVDALTGDDAQARGSDGYLTGSRLGAYLEEKIINYSERRQHPVYGKLAHPDFDDGDFLFPRVGDPVGEPIQTAELTEQAVTGTRGQSPELRIVTPQAPREHGHAAFVADKLARNLVEYFVENGLKVSSELTAREPLRPPTHALHLRVTPLGGDLSIDAELTDANNHAVGVATLEGPAEFLRRHYKVLPEALVHMLDVSATSLQPLNTAKQPTDVAIAYTAALAARRMASMRRLDDAVELLEFAIELDDRFAAAHDALAQLAEIAGEPSAAAKHHSDALAIDPDFTRMPIFAGDLMGNPVPALLADTGQWETLVPGLEARAFEAEAHGVSVRAWRFDPSLYDLATVASDSGFGSSVADLRDADGALLAINAGFFELDMRSRVSPVGLLVVNGREISPFDAEKARTPLSGILYRRGKEIGILPAREFQPSDRFDMALQSGPLVVDPGGANGIYTNRFDRLPRSGLCIDATGHPIIVQVSGGLSLYEFGELLSTTESNHGLGCERAINLDGGPSSQVSVAVEGGILEVPGLWKVHSALLLRERAN